MRHSISTPRLTAQTLRNLARDCVRDRRSFLASSASLLCLPWMAQIGETAPLRNVAFASDPFRLGVASGDPDSVGFVLWTRLVLDPDAPAGGMQNEDYEVRWEVASDEQMQKIVKSGKTVASRNMGHSVHVELDGLDADRWYFYRFHCGDATSPVGRTRTMPRTDAVPEQLRFAFASCQHYETGLYTAYQHMSREPLDLILHLGDYIYEGAGKEGRLRLHSSDEIHSLDDYRKRYAQYKSDRDLIGAHLAAPWLVVWDDHEFDNNYANLVSEEKGVAPTDFAVRRANAYQAYYENMPLRATSIPKGHDMQLYRRVRFGQLAQFDMLDTRQYRTDQPNGDGSKELVGDVFDPKATLLGEAQEQWLLDGLANSPARWNILAQQVMMARADRAAGSDRKFSMDQWSGYDVARKRLLRGIQERQRTGAVVLTGDIHNNWANNLLVDFDKGDEKPVATEFVGTSISSGGNGQEKPKYLETLLSENPFVKFHNTERGYVSCEVTAKLWTTRFQTVPFVDKPGAELVTRGTFHVEAGKPGLA